MHHFQKVPLGGFEDEMIVIIHENITMNEDPVTVMVILKYSLEPFPIPIIKEDFLPLISSAGDVI
jgi:hypothetical protein